MRLTKNPNKSLRDLLVCRLVYGLLSQEKSSSEVGEVVVCVKRGFAPPDGALREQRITRDARFVKHLPVTQKMPNHSIFPDIPTSGPRGHDLTGKEAAQGTCHKCGGSLSRGNAGLAKQCGACGTRFHMSDCGERLAAAGYHDVFDQCPKVRRPESRLFTRERADDAPPNPRAPFPPHMDLESCVYAVSGFFVLGDRTRRGCCARSIIPGAVRSARGVDRVARSLDRASPAGFHAQPHRPTGRVLTHSPRGQTSHPRVFHGPFTSNRGFGDSR